MRRSNTSRLLVALFALTGRAFADEADLAKFPVVQAASDKVVDVVNKVGDVLDLTETNVKDAAAQMLQVTLDEDGCYIVKGADLKLSLCEGEDAAKQPALYDALPYSWVNGTVTNLGDTSICGFSFDSHDLKLSNAISVLPAFTPVGEVTMDLEPGQKVEFSFLLPFDRSTNSAPFVGIADTIHSCPDAVVKAPALPAPVTVVPAVDEAAEAVAGAAADAAGAAANAVAEPKTSAALADEEGSVKATSGAGLLSSSLVFAMVGGAMGAFLA